MRTNGIKKNHKIYIFKHQQTESGGGGGANLENNKTATIDVSAYTGPVAITPTAGKDGMKKATVTLSNIPSGQVTAYCWHVADIGVSFWFEFPTAPDSRPNSDCPVLLSKGESKIEIDTWDDSGLGDYTYEKIDDSTIKLTSSDEVLTMTRLSNKDFTLW